MKTSNLFACSLASFPTLADRRPRRASVSILRQSLLPGLILLGLLGRPAQAVDITAVPFTITQPGTYTLSMDLDWPGSGGAIAIVASNVILDLGGHTLSGTWASTGIRLEGGVSGVTVMNGVVSGFNIDVLLDNVSGNTVTGITASFSAVAGIYLTTSSDNLIQGNLCANGSTYGIQLAHSNHNTLLENTASGNFTAGIAVGGDDNELASNTTDNNGDGVGGGYGILLQVSHGNFLHGNTASNNAWGIALADSSSANTLLMNTTNSNTDVGIGVLGGSGNTVRNNTANNNSVVGIFCQLSSGNLFHKNTALNTGVYDLEDTDCTNTWKKNVFVTSNGACIE